MKILLLGATGGVGSHLLRTTLAAGHDVRVLVRDATALDTSDGVDVVVGDATTASHMAEAVDGRKRWKGTLAGTEGHEVLIEVDEGTVGLPFDWLSDAKLVLSDELIAENLKRSKRPFRPEDYDEVTEITGDPDRPDGPLRQYA